MLETAKNKMCKAMHVQEISCRIKDGVRESCALTPRKEQPTGWKLLSVYLTASSIAIKEISCFLSVSCFVGLEEST